MPMAVRRKERTTTIRVNDVTIISSDGARLRTVSNNTNCTTRPVLDAPGLGPRSRVRLCADAPSGNVHNRALKAMVKTESFNSAGNIERANLILENRLFTLGGCSLLNYRFVQLAG